MDIETLLVALAKSFEKSGVRALLVDGLALGAHGVQRFTKDIDFLVCEDDLELFRSVMESHGLRQRFRSELCARFNAPDLPFVDAVVVAATTFDKAWEQAVSHNIQGIAVCCASCRTLLAMKLHASKHGAAHRGMKDLLDILELVKANDIDVQAPEFVDLCVKYADKEVLCSIQTMLSK